MVVVLPAPFGPRKACTSPARTSRSSPSSATVRPNDLRKPTVRSTASLVVRPVTVVLMQTLYTVELAIARGLTRRGRLGRMALLRVDARPLLPRLRGELTALLASLPGGDWAHPTPCPGWSVHDLAAHLLGVELGNVSVRRDRWELGPGEGEDLDGWLNRFNQQWVDAAQRISPALLIELINVAGLRFEEHVATLDLDAAGGPVEWATGSDPAPVWLDVAREYMERYVHQEQIRRATGRPRSGPPLPARSW